MNSEEDTPNDNIICIKGRKYIVIDVPHDGNCFFSCLSYEQANNFSKAAKIRKNVCSHIYEHWSDWQDEVRGNQGVDMTKEQYRTRMIHGTEGATRCEIGLASSLYECSINVWMKIRKGYHREALGPEIDNHPINLLLHENHYRYLRELDKNDSKLSTKSGSDTTPRTIPKASSSVCMTEIPSSKEQATSKDAPSDVEHAHGTRVKMINGKQFSVSNDVPRYGNTFFSCLSHELTGDFSTAEAIRKAVCEHIYHHWPQWRKEIQRDHSFEMTKEQYKVNMVDNNGCPTDSEIAVASMLCKRTIIVWMKGRKENNFKSQHFVYQSKDSPPAVHILLYNNCYQVLSDPEHSHHVTLTHERYHLINQMSCVRDSDHTQHNNEGPSCEQSKAENEGVRALYGCNSNNEHDASSVLTAAGMDITSRKTHLTPSANISEPPAGSVVAVSDEEDKPTLDDTTADILHVQSAHDSLLPDGQVELHCSNCLEKQKDLTFYQAHMLTEKACFFPVTKPFWTTSGDIWNCNICDEDAKSELCLKVHCFDNTACKLGYIKLAFKDNSSVSVSAVLPCANCTVCYKDLTSYQAHLLDECACFYPLTEKYWAKGRDAVQSCRVCNKDMKTQMDLKNHCFKATPCRLAYIKMFTEDLINGNKEKPEVISGPQRISDAVQRTGSPSISSTSSHRRNSSETVVSFQDMDVASSDDDTVLDTHLQSLHNTAAVPRISSKQLSTNDLTQQGRSRRPRVSRSNISRRQRSANMCEVCEISFVCPEDLEHHLATDGKCKEITTFLRSISCLNCNKEFPEENLKLDHIINTRPCEGYLRDAFEKGEFHGSTEFYESLSLNPTTCHYCLFDDKDLFHHLIFVTPCLKRLEKAILIFRWNVYGAPKNTASNLNTSGDNREQDERFTQVSPHTPTLLRCLNCNKRFDSGTLFRSHVLGRSECLDFYDHARRDCPDDRGSCYVCTRN